MRSSAQPGAVAIIAAALLVAASAGSAAAQETAAPPATQKPLVIEQIHSPFVIAPEYKVTEVDGDWRQLAGVYAGRLFDEQLLIAGAVYTLVNGPDRTDLTYGGLLIGWSTPEARLRFGARALIVGGRSTLPVTLWCDVCSRARSDPRAVPDSTVARFGTRTPLTPQNITVSARDDFAVIEQRVRRSGARSASNCAKVCRWSNRERDDLQRRASACTRQGGIYSSWFALCGTSVWLRIGETGRIESRHRRCALPRVDFCLQGHRILSVCRRAQPHEAAAP
jgi:hypothetical protein